MTTIPLTVPIANSPIIHRALALRKPTFGDAQTITKAATLDNLDDAVAVVARLAGVPVKVAAAIDFADVEAVVIGLGTHLRHVPPHVLNSGSTHGRPNKFTYRLANRQRERPGSPHQ